MKVRKLILNFVTVIMLLSMTVGVALAEDGVIFRRNISKTPEGETEKAAIYMMDFYVPAQASTGELVSIDNYLIDDGDDITTNDVMLDPREFAKPLISVYIDDRTHELETKGGISFGQFDAFVGVSLDDGTTWKTSNLSNSADLSSIFLSTTGEAYPGDVHNVVHQVAGDRIFVAWASKYCSGGTPLYSYLNDDGVLQDPLNAPYLENLENTYGKDAVYLYDLFGVAGSQKTVDYTLVGFPEIGEIPYSCIWTARGKLLPGDDAATADFVEATHVIWTKPERLTSGKRDANLPAVDCAKDAGCILTWQEDPEGLRPGQGLGPGEGWSGAIANAQTDIWYSYISYQDFDDVFTDPLDNTSAPIEVEEFLGETMPKAYVPMAMPVRLTDNTKCKGLNTTLKPSDPYCYIDFDTIDDINLSNVAPLITLEAPETDADYCADTIDWTTPGGSTQPVCVTDDGRVLNGRVASTRVRLNLKPYTPADAPEGQKSAWVIMAAEETKALGDILIDPYGNETEDPIDIGKDVWYYTFDMFDHIMIDQGGILNQPAICNPNTVGAAYPDDCNGEDFFPVQIEPLNGGDYYLTEIARRFALTTNSVQAAVDSESGLAAMLIYKQGIINQGGPADIFLRRVVIDDTVFNPAVDNPYAFENMECVDDPDNPNDGWAYTNEDNGGTNPNYLKGICLSPAINISGSTIVECSGATGNDACAATFPVADDGSIPDNETSFPKVLEWRQCDGLSETVGGVTGCEELDNDLDDQSWDNPFDVAKGHRGFLDGDFVMMMYAWAPNWKANTVGNDHYNLYTRRSFDGGLTWTTTPGDLEGLGTSSTENYCVSTSSEDCVGTEFTYAAGAFEQGRNVSQLIGNKVTILDPRYTPTGGLKLYPFIRTDWLNDELEISFDGYPDDMLRVPSVFFMVYETGDNTTVTDGEAVPLDLFYSRATVYGDVWELDPDWYDEETGEIEDYRWPWLENKKDDLSGEAGMLANPGGTFMYTVWNQWKEEIGEDGHELVYDSDMIFRRLLYNDNLELTPVTVIEFQSADMIATSSDDVLTLIISARDLDRLGDGDEIIAIEWSIDGIVYNGCDSKVCNVPARTLSEGWDGFDNQAGSGGYGSHEIAVRVKDNDPNRENPAELGNWSKHAKTAVIVADTIYKVRLPMVIGQ